jgi:hypothetical protein
MEISHLPMLLQATPPFPLGSHFVKTVHGKKKKTLMIIREISILTTRKARTKVPKQFFEVKKENFT